MYLKLDNSDALYILKKHLVHPSPFRDATREWYDSKSIVHSILMLMKEKIGTIIHFTSSHCCAKVFGICNGSEEVFLFLLMT